MARAIFGAGCFWGIELAFRKVVGVTSATVGYSGGPLENPSYEDVCTGRTGHAEVVRLEYDPAVVPYETLVETFFQVHDPTTLNRQGPDVGDQYRSAIFFHDAEQEATAHEVKKRLDESGQLLRPIVTEVLRAGVFYPAEEYHQRYLEKRGLGR